MTGDQKPRQSDASGSDQGWAVIGYLLAGMIVWGGAGWLLDEWLNIPKHLGTFFGLVLGAAAGLYLVVKHMGQTPSKPDDDKGEGRKR